MRRKSFDPFLWVIATFIVLTASRGAAQSAATESNLPIELRDALIVAIDADAANLSVRKCPDPPKVCDDSPLTNIRVDAPALRAILKPFQVGDRVRLKITYNKASAPKADAPASTSTTQVRQPSTPVATDGAVGPPSAVGSATEATNQNSQRKPDTPTTGTPEPKPKEHPDASLPDASSETNAAILADFLGPYTSGSLDLWKRIVVLLGVGLALLGTAALVTGGRPQVFLIGMDNRYSNSKVQIALWFWIVISTYVAAWCFRIYVAGWHFAGMVNIPQNLLLLSGLSAITYGGAKAITTSKADSADPAAKVAAAAQTASVATAQANLAKAKANLAGQSTDAGRVEDVTHAQTEVDRTPKVVPGTKTQATDADRKFLANLLQNDSGGFDFGDFQMLVVTVIAAVTYLILFVVYFENVAFTKAITLPDVDTTILSIFGLGQGAYLAKKAGGDVGTS